MMKQPGARTLKISYRATFNDPVSQSPATGEDPGFGVSGAITGDGTFLGDSALWYPVPWRTPAQRSVAITAPAGTEGISYGRLVSRRTSGSVSRSVWEEAHPVGVLTLCAGPYRVESVRVDGIEIYSYFHAENASLAPAYLEATAKYLRFYSELLGPYPFEKFAVVENFFQTGYAFPSFTLLGGMVIRLPFILGTSLPHEIAHSWWGNGVEVEQQEGNWCEGLVTYLADYLLRERRSEVYRSRRYGAAAWSDFTRAFSRAAGKDLAPFMNQWLARPGAPGLSLQGVAGVRKDGGWSVSGKAVQAGPLYDLRLPVLLETAGKPVERSIRLARERTEFAVASPDRPKRLLLDPESQLFRRLAPEEIPATVNSLKGSQRLVAVLTDDCRAAADTVRELVASLSRADAEVVREADWQGRASGADLLFCGLPRDRALLSFLPQDAVFSGGGVEVSGERFLFGTGTP